jgi:hypothetical protein
MSAATLLLSASLALLAGLLYLVVGRVSARRRSAGESSLAQLAFSIWWYALGISAILQAAVLAVATADAVDFALFFALSLALLAAICLALWGLLFYLTYIFFGARSIAWPLAGFYLAYFAGWVFLLVRAQPSAVIVERWRVRLDLGPDFQADPLVGTFIVLLLLPQILGAIAYFTLYFRTHDPSQRYRIALISAAIFGWFTSSLVATSTNLANSDFWTIASRLIGVAATLTVLAAYLPPRFVRDILARRAAAQVAPA